MQELTKGRHNHKHRHWNKTISVQIVASGTCIDAWY